jgi:RING-H2 zinc finger domain
MARTKRKHACASSSAGDAACASSSAGDAACSSSSAACSSSSIRTPPPPAKDDIALIESIVGQRTFERLSRDEGFEAFVREVDKCWKLSDDPDEYANAIRFRRLFAFTSLSTMFSLMVSTEKKRFPTKMIRNNTFKFSPTEFLKRKEVFFLTREYILRANIIGGMYEFLLKESSLHLLSDLQITCEDVRRLDPVAIHKVPVLVKELNHFCSFVLAPMTKQGQREVEDVLNMHIRDKKNVLPNVFFAASIMLCKGESMSTEVIESALSQAIAGCRLTTHVHALIKACKAVPGIVTPQIMRKCVSEYFNDFVKFYPPNEAVFTHRPVFRALVEYCQIQTAADAIRLFKPFVRAPSTLFVIPSIDLYLAILAEMIAVWPGVDKLNDALTTAYVYKASRTRSLALVPTSDRVNGRIESMCAILMFRWCDPIDKFLSDGLSKLGISPARACVIVAVDDNCNLLDLQKIAKHFLVSFTEATAAAVTEAEKQSVVKRCNNFYVDPAAAEMVASEDAEREAIEQEYVESFAGDFVVSRLKNDADVCSICYESFFSVWNVRGVDQPVVSGPSVVFTTCVHTFHASCLQTALRITSNSCPMCRKDPVIVAKVVEVPRSTRAELSRWIGKCEGVPRHLADFVSAFRPEDGSTSVMDVDDE